MNKLLIKQLASLLPLLSLVFGLTAQCPQLANITVTQQPTTCSNALNIVPYFTQCRTITMSNVNAGASTGVNDLGCFGGSAPNDVWLKALNPYNSIPGYDGSLVFRWVDWPGRTTGAPNPTIAMHAEIAGSAAGGLVTINMDCTAPAPTQSANFALENAFCINPTVTAGGQFFAAAGTLPTVAQIQNSGQVPSGINLTNIEYYLQCVASNNLTGNMSFEVSPYKRGFLCGDALNVTLTGNSSLVSGSVSSCLCETALNGCITANSTNAPLGLTMPCGQETQAAGWYAITLPFACNKVSLSVPSWGGTGSYNLALLSGVNCTGTSGLNPLTGQTVFTPGQTLAPGAVIEAGACSQSLSICKALPAGTYYVYISGATERPTFTLNVSVENATPNVGTLSSVSNNTNVCSGSTIQVSNAGASMPFAACGSQRVLYYYGTSLNFNPYNGQGTLIPTAANATNVSLTLPANNSCQPITYYIKAVISDDGTTAVAGCRGTSNTISINVLPEIGAASVLNNPCIITVAGRCPSFTVNGTPGTNIFTATFADDGTQRTFVISNGLAGCNVSTTETVSCSGNCTQPTASATSVCNPSDIYNFYVDVVFTPGSASSYIIQGSDGSQLAVSNAGTYRVGPFANGNNISLQVTNTEDANCNLPLGSFTRRCNATTCPSLVGAVASITGGGNSICSGGNVQLQAFTDRGIVNQDYRIQWYTNGTAITGATFPSYVHSVGTTQGCAPEVQTYSVQLFCLDAAAAPAAVSQMNVSTGNITAYPVPVLGRDFTTPSANCIVAPTDICGNLNVSFSPQITPTAGSSTTVTYTIAVQGAPSGCAASGSYITQCLATSCTNVAGTGSATDGKVCFGGTTSVSATGTSLRPGFNAGIAYTQTNPYGNLEAAVQSAVSAGRFYGPLGVNGSQNITNDGSVFTPGTWYFIPFVAMDINSTNIATFAYSTNGTLNAPFGGSGVSNTVTIPTLPFCPGVTSYRGTYTASRASGIGNPINSVAGFTTALSYTGGTTANVSLTDANITVSPSGRTMVLGASSSFGSNVNYAFNVSPTRTYPFPTMCPTCMDVGNPVAIEFLPQITLGSLASASLCVGDSLDLVTRNPSSNVAGTYRWFGTPPAANTQPLNSTIVRPASMGSSYYVRFYASADSTCTANAVFNVTPTALPVLNAPAPPAPICAGQTVNLNSLNSSITTASGTFVWYRGNPTTDPFAVRYPTATASAIQPTNGTIYYAQFTSAATGCRNQSQISYTVNPLPALTAPAVNPGVCQGSAYDLSTLQSTLTTSAGTFRWFRGTTLLTSTSVTPTTTDRTFTAEFTATSTGCASRININLDINALPTLTSPGQQGPACSNTEVDLTQLESQITTQAGTFEWFRGNPASGGVAISTPSAHTLSTTANYFVRFTSALTTCKNTTSFNYLVNPSPTLNVPTLPSLCAGQSVSLATFEPQMATSGGAFTWFRNGTQLTFQQAQSQTPTAQDTFKAVFANGFGCTATRDVIFNVNPTPVLSNVSPANQCFGTNFDLTTLNAQLTSNAGTFTWATSTGATLTLAQSQSQVLSTSATYSVNFRDANNCSATQSIDIDVYAVVSGATAAYDCTNNVLAVNLSTATGGSGAGYQVAANSPNQNGQTIANGLSWTVVVEDNAGCRQANITGTVNCIVCDAGNAGTPSLSTVCCQETTNIPVNNVVTRPGFVTAWALTNSPVTDTTQARQAANAGRVFVGNGANGSLNYNNDCSTLPAGNYFATPFLVQDPNIRPLVYDTLNGCIPNGAMCPRLIADPLDTNWVMDPLLLGFPDGSFTNVNQSLAFGFPISQPLLTAFTGGSLPCIELRGLFRGNPNGTWTVSVTNTGTGALTFDVPAFNVTVSGATCAPLGGTDQVSTVPARVITVPPNGGSAVIAFTLPTAPSGFPNFGASCIDFGQAAPVTIDRCVGFEEIALLSNVQLFPNPTDSDATLRLDLTEASHISLAVQDYLGRTLQSKDLGWQSEGTLSESIQLSGLANGIYFVRVRTDKGEQVMKLVLNGR